MPKNKIQPYLVHSIYTDSIRQMPQNYLIAHKQLDYRWVCTPDLACDKTLATKVFIALLDYDNRYGSAEKVLAEVKNIDIRIERNTNA